MVEDNIIQIPRIGFIEAVEFYNSDVRVALANCIASGKQPMFMPEIADARIALSKYSRIWKLGYSAPSIMTIGKTKQGNAVVVYAHVPHYFSNPHNLKKVIKQKLFFGDMPQKEFQRLLDIEDCKRVFVVDYKYLNSKQGVVDVSKALKHPHIIPFFGGESRAEAYLKKHEKVKGKTIGIWYSTELIDKPNAYCLFLGRGYIGDSGDTADFYGNGRFLGSTEKTDFRNATEAKSINLEKMLIIAKKYSPNITHDALKKEMQKLYIGD